MTSSERWSRRSEIRRSWRLRRRGAARLRALVLLRAGALRVRPEDDRGAIAPQFDVQARMPARIQLHVKIALWAAIPP
jgi:hypothetical protein